ncbi:MAG: PAS domain S-box protein, partial [Nitrospira sp.]|nr:PAS domain S-box protein [Nitrospira sp.]
MPRKTLQTSVKKGAREAARKKAVKAGNDFCQALFEWGDDAIFLFDRIGRCLDVNPSGCRLLGSSPRRLRSRLLTEILLSLDGSDDCRRLQGLRRGQTKSCGLRVCRDDGREVPVDARAKGLAQGCVLVVLRERSVSLPIHEQLRESERFLDSVLEYLPGIVFIKDAADLRFVRFNKAGVELLGYTRDELLGKNDYDCFPQHEADFFTAKDREVLASGRLLDIAEEPIQTRVNGMRLLHTKKVPILDEHGRPQYLLGLSEDITEQYQQRVRDADRRQQLKRLAELSLTLSGDPDEVLDQAVRIIGELFSVKVVCVSEIVGRDLHFKSVYVNGKVFRDVGGCPLAVTPCATVEKNKDLRIFDHVTERFPQAAFLKDHQAVGYCGFPATGHSGRVVAVTCLLDDKPLALTEDEQDILRIFGQRIASEIERAGHIAEQQRAEDRLRLSEARMESLLSASPAVIYSSKATGDYGAIFVSDNVTKILGYRQEEFIADSGFWADRIHPDDRERVFAELPRLFDRGM